MQRLSGKVAIITGAAQGMGAEHARRFVAEGAYTVFTDINAEAGAALQAELGERSLFVRHDVGSEGSPGFRRGASRRALRSGVDTGEQRRYPRSASRRPI